MSKGLWNDISLLAAMLLGIWVGFITSPDLGQMMLAQCARTGVVEISGGGTIKCEVVKEEK